MERTSKLMSAFSSLFGGKAPVPGTVPASDQTEPQPNEPWRTDPQVRQAADTILPWLNAWTPLSGPEYSPTVVLGMRLQPTQEDILKKFPEIGTALVPQALKLLISQGAIQQTGDGSQEHPYRYQHFSHHHG